MAVTRGKLVKAQIFLALFVAVSVVSHPHLTDVAADAAVMRDVDNLFTATSISASDTSTCAVRPDRSVTCLGTVSYQPYGVWNPVSGYRETGFADVIQIGVGRLAGCALKATGTVHCWGEGRFGAIGNGSTSDVSFSNAAQVSGITNAVSVSSSNSVSIPDGPVLNAHNNCVVLVDRTAKCWGTNIAGSLGDGTQTVRSSPVAVADLSDIQAVETGPYHSCALIHGGQVKCWGPHQLLGAGLTTSPALGEKVDVVGVSDAVQLSIGFATSCALRTGGTVKCWGSGYEGMLGDGITGVVYALSPVLVSGLTDAISIAVGGRRACAITASSAVKCWGENSDGVLDPSYEDVLTPRTITSLGSATSVTVGSRHICVTKENGLVQCLGDNGSRQIDRAMNGKVRRPVWVRNTQEIDFEIAASAAAGSTLSPNLSNTSGLETELRVTSSAGVCEASHNQVLLFGVGSCRVVARQEGDDFFLPAVDVERLVVASAFTWSGTRTNVSTTLRFRTADGVPVTGLRVTWSALDSQFPASGSGLVTNSSGTVTMTTISGPAIIRVVSIYSSESSAVMQKSTVDQFLRSFSTVVNLAAGTTDINVGTRPTTETRTVQVRLADGTPVPGAIVYLAVTRNLWESPSRTLSGKRKDGFAVWNTSHQRDTMEPCFNDGNSFYDASGTNIFGITGSDGRVTLRAYPTLGDESLLSVCYSDSEFTQKRNVSIATSGTTQVDLGYNARVSVFTTEIFIQEDERPILLALVSDSSGDPLQSKTVDAMHFIADDRVETANCPGVNSVTDSRGFASVVFCPARTGLYYFRANGAVPSQFVRVTFRTASPPSDSGDDEPTTTPSPESTTTSIVRPLTTIAPATTVAPTTPTTVVRSASRRSPKLPLSAGSIISVGTPPPSKVATGVAVAVTSRVVTIGLVAPDNTSRSQKVTQYVVTLLSGSGSAVRRVVLTVRGTSTTRITSINVPQSGIYTLQIVARNNSGKRVGSWRSASFTVAKRPGI